jgi:HK97 family phage portal protein
MPRTELIRVTNTPKPSFLSRVVDTFRAYTIGPLTSRSPELAKYFDGGGGSLAGVSVTEHTALRNSAVWAAVGLISDDVSSLPLMLYKRTDNGGKLKFDTHPLYRLIHDEPNPEMSSMVFRRTMQAHVLIWGNGYAEIERDGVGRPVYLWPLEPERVRHDRDRAGNVIYRVMSASGGEAIIPAADMLHLVGRSHDGSVGSSLVQHARESIGLALAAEQFGSTFFGNGATFGGVISFKGPKPPEMSETGYKDSLEARHQGVKRAHKLLALYNDAQYKETGVEPNSAQFLETRQFQILEVCRWFKLPPHKLAHLSDATFSNVEQQNVDYFVSAIRPWLVLWEQELTRKLVRPLERSIQAIEHSVEGFLRGDSAARAAFYRALFDLGAITPNEIRAYENMNPLPGGDLSFVPANNLVPLEKIGEYADAMIDRLEAAAKPEPAPAPAPDMPDDGPDEDVQAMRQTLDGIEARLVDRLTAAESAKAVADAQAEALRADVEAAAKSLAERDGALAALAARHADDLKAQIGQTAEQIAELDRQWAAERAVLQQQRDAAQAEKNDLDVMLGAVERERDEARAEAAKQAEQAAQALEQERAAYEAVCERLQRRSAVPQLHRGLYADAMGRMVRREIAKAKSYQATPSKLRTWIAAFYDEAEMRIFTEALLPSLRVHLAWIGSTIDPEEFTRELVARHFSESSARLTAVCDAGADGYGDVLQRVLSRWERERAEQFADALLAEEMTHDGRAA